MFISSDYIWTVIKNYVPMRTQKEKQEYKLKHGNPYPPGCSVTSGGINFSIFSRHATSADLLLFATADCEDPFQVIHLTKEKNRTFFSWHVFVKDLPPGVWHCWRLDGPYDPQYRGLRFDREKQLLDPWARVVSDRRWRRGAACVPGDNSQAAMRCAVVDLSDYDWEGDTPLRISSEKAIVY